MKEQQERSKANSGFNVVVDSKVRRMIDLIEKGKIQGGKTTEFVHKEMSIHSQMILSSGFEELPSFAAVLKKTPFYVEAGGQVSDIGLISSSDNTWTMRVDQVKIHKDYYIHFGEIIDGDVTGNFDIYKQDLKVSVDRERRWDIMRNHTGTHLMHAALREVLGDHVKQSGSYVGPDRLRFDFSHHQPMTDDEISRVEEIVNAEILKRAPITTDIMDIDDAKKTGAMALFGEKYADKVRVVSVPGFSKELCGGTHVENVSQIGLFIITLETGIASGVRRIEAITGREAIKYMMENKRFRREASRIIGRPEAEALAGIEQLREDHQALQKELKRTKEAMFTGGSKTVGKEQVIGNIKWVSNEFKDEDRSTIGSWTDATINDNSPVIATALGHVNGKDIFIVAASGSALQVGFDSASFLKDVVNNFDGRGGGKSSFAQGTVAPGTLSEALFGYVEEKIKDDFSDIDE